MKLIDIHKEQRRRPATQDVRYPIPAEEAGLASELGDLITEFCEAFNALVGTRCEKLDTIEW